MKEAIANVGVFNLIIIFVIILLSFFIGSLGYSKAFKVKNLIIDEIEKNEGYDNIVEENIVDLLSQIGYRINTDFDNNNCRSEQFNGKTENNINTSSDYQFCVYRFEVCSSKNSNSNNEECVRQSVHYRVVTYMYFDVPIINNLIRIPVKGETKTFTEINS